MTSPRSCARPRTRARQGDPVAVAERLAELRAALEAGLERRALRRGERPLCGARCRSRGGEPCRARVCERPDGRGLAKRCKNHGGRSLGPTTAAGLQRCAEAGRRGRQEQLRRAQEAKQ